MTRTVTELVLTLASCLALVSVIEWLRLMLWPRAFNISD